MSKCTSLFNKASGCRYMARPLDCCCTDENDICVHAPTGEPRCLTLLAPVVFDECGINLCKVFQRNVFANPAIQSMEVRVLDIDWNMSGCEGSSHVERLRSRPNCSRITLSNIRVKMAVTLLDCCSNILDSFIMTETYLPSCPEDPCYDEETNPCSICLELYTPYGLSYQNQDPPMPTINCIGLEEDGSCGPGNNSLRQGLCAQALSKAVRFDSEDGLVALGLTLYLKVVYFVQYRMAHEGLATPPKCSPVMADKTDACRDFVDGDLLALNLQPLEALSRSSVSDPGSSSGCNNNCNSNCNSNSNNSCNSGGNTGNRSGCGCNR